jgi:hypothetical protein
MCKSDLKHFRTISDAPRRLAMRAHLVAHAGIAFGASHEDLTSTQRRALDDMAKAVSWRKGIANRLTLAAAFYVYLSRDVPTKPAAVVVRQQVAQRRPFLFGRGAA